MDAHIFGLLTVIICVTETSYQVIVKHPEDATVMEGDNVTLTCVFSEIIPICTWFRSNDPVDINGRYKYIEQNANGTNTTDCSILIISFKTFDAVKWQCSNKQGWGIQTGVKSNTANLEIIKSNKTTSTLPAKESSENPPNVSTEFLSGNNSIIIILSVGLLLTAVIITLIMYQCRSTKGQKKIGTNIERMTSEMPQCPPCQELHEYVNIRTQKDTPEEDEMGYLVPKSDPKYHIYETIPE